MSYSYLQVELERKYAKQNTTYLLSKSLKDSAVIQQIVSSLETYLNQEEDFIYWTKDNTQKYRYDLEEAHTKLLQLDLKIVVEDLFCFLWSQDGRPVTIQAMVGKLMAYLDGMSSVYRKTVAASIVLDKLADSPVVKLEANRGETIVFRSAIELPTELREQVNKQGFVLPSITKPKPVENNHDLGYSTFKGSLILGGKYHDKAVNYNHINRANAIAYKHEFRLTELTEPVFKTERKVKKDGAWETDADVVQRYKSFKDIHDKLPVKLDILKKYTDHFYFTHAYCTRGRIYVNAYEFNYQGSGHLKAMTDFHKKELIQPEF